MPPPKRMTANPVRPARHRPGKPGATLEAESSSESSSEDDEQEEQVAASKPKAPAPPASSFPKDTSSKLSNNLSSIDLNARQKEAAAQEQARKDAEQNALEDEFETEESESEEESDSEEESEEESSSEDEAAKRKLLRPVFMKKGARDAATNGDKSAVTKTEDEKWAEEEARRKGMTDVLLKEQLEKNAQARAQGKVFWDDDKVEEEIDDTDDLDPEAERAAWKLRELRRVKRERDALIAAEKEREEIERRRNLTAEEREAEDREFLAAQKEERDGRGKMGYMQKYFHKGAFFMDDSKAAELAGRDIMGGRYADDVTDRSALPQFMQIRDMTKLGKKGRTRYKDMRSEDTGRFGDYGDRRKPRDMDLRGVDDRFQPEHDRDGGPGATGANAKPLGERKRPGEDFNREDKRPRVT